MIRPTNRIVHLRYCGLPGRLHLPATRLWNGGREERGTHGTPTNEHISLKRLDSCMSTLLNFICSRNLFNPLTIAVGNLVPVLPGRGRGPRRVHGRLGPDPPGR